MAVDKYLQFRELNLVEAADFLGVTVNYILNAVANGELTAKFKHPHMADEWHTIDSRTIKRTFDSGSNTIELITIFENEEDTTSDWDRAITFEQAKIFKDELVQYKSTKIPKALKIIKPDMTEIRFDGDLFVFSADKAGLIKVMYDRIKSHPDSPAIHEKIIFNLAEYDGESESRIDKIFKTEKQPTILNNLIIKTAPATYRLAPFIEI